MTLYLLASLCKKHDDLFGKSDDKETRKIQIRLYDASPTVSIYGYDNTNIVGLYWEGASSISSPQLEISDERIVDRERTVHTTDDTKRNPESAVEPFLAKAVIDHFESLWSVSPGWDPRTPDSIPEVSLSTAQGHVRAATTANARDRAGSDRAEL